MSRTTEQIVADMLIDYKEIAGVELSSSDLKRDEVISLYPHAGAIASIEAKIEGIEDNFHPSSSDDDGLEKHLASRQLPTRRQPSKSQGRIKFTGTNNSLIGIGAVARRNLDGKLYVSIQEGIIVSGIIVNTFESGQTGQEYNIDPIGEEFTLVNPIAGVDNACLSDSQFLNGRDLETPGEMLQRIQEKDRRINTGGNLTAYEAYAKEASALVVTATAIKHPRGESTVNTVITSGTTDIDKAVEDGTNVLRIPSPELIATVQAYIVINCPTTDDHLTIAPVEEIFNTSITLVLHDESLRPQVVSSITKLWKIFVYKAKAGQTIYPTQLEQVIDSKLKHLIKYRRVQDFSIDHSYKIPEAKILNPNILVISGP